MVSADDVRAHTKALVRDDTFPVVTDSAKVATGTTMGAKTQRDIERKAFSLHVDLDAVDPAKNAGAVLATSSVKEVAELDRYWRGEMG